MLTYEEVSKELEYDPQTGIVTWQRNGRVNPKYAGKEAGNRNKGGYIDIRCKNHRMYAHRVAWLLTYKEWPKGQVDHINGIRDDNRIENLRVVDNQQNHKNMKQHKGNTSGATGVYWNKRAKKWQAYICVDKEQIYLGIYDTIEEAAAVRKDAELMYRFHKNHGRINSENPVKPGV